jgi:transcriptional regulator with XRE-family HTH domain
VSTSPAKTERKQSREQGKGSAGGEFGSHLRTARAERGLTLRDVSDASGISVAYLSDLERGVLENPTLEKLRQLALALDISLNNLLGVEEQDSSKRLPDALEEFRALSTFRQTVQEEARRTSRDADRLEGEWIETLSRIHVGGRRPRSPADYLFIFEAIRRAIERR